MTPALYNTDALAWLRDQPDGAFDLCLTDPPYDERTHAGARTNKVVQRDNEIDFAPMCPAVFVPDLLRVTRRWVVCFCTSEMLAEYRDAAGDAYVRGGVWHKTNATPQITGDRPAQWGDAFAIMHRAGAKHWHGGGLPAFVSGASGLHDKQAEGLTHPTVKPRYLMRTLLKWFADEGDHVLDPFMGSGTTGVVCAERGHPFTGIEIDPKYYAEAVARIACVTAQPGLTLTPKPRQPRLA